MESEQAELGEEHFSEGQGLEQEVGELTEEQTIEEKVETTSKQRENNAESTNEENKSSFIHGLSVGLGMGCIATFIIIWITVFFSPMLPPTITYESMLSIFIYPLLYLLAVGLIALTAGIVREYYTRK